MYDVFVIGGGINGCGIARAAAGRGYSVYLAEKDDLASGTSSWSTKLIHGGLRYLEHFEFRLVREALIEREVLWQMAPHIIRPLRFILPHHQGLRPVWLLRLGLFIYDYLGGKGQLPLTQYIDLRHHKTGIALNKRFNKAFAYSDCRVDDARLVVVNAQDAKQLGADINTRTEVIGAKRNDDHWQVSVVCENKQQVIYAKSLVNAAGPWVNQLLGRLSGKHDSAVRLVKGSHIVVNKKFDHCYAYIFQNSDGRIFFAIPYEQNFTLIGTTDEDYQGAVEDVCVSDNEIDYLCDNASAYFDEPVRPKDVVWQYAGVRPLYDEKRNKSAKTANRDYVIKTDDSSALLINIFGGKLTTYRRLSEKVLSAIERHLAIKSNKWHADSSLPGGNFAATDFAKMEQKLSNDYPFLSVAYAQRLFRQYGTLAWNVLAESKCYADLGQHFSADLYQQEVDYLIRNEWAKTADDIVWRRTKCALYIDANGKKTLEKYVNEKNCNPHQQCLN